MTSTMVKKLLLTALLVAAIVAMGFVFWALFYDGSYDPGSEETTPLTLVDTVNLNSTETLNELLDQVDTILLDCDGVLYVNSKAAEGAAEVVNMLAKRGKKLAFVTNTSTRSRSQVLKTLTDMGFQNLTIDQIIGVTYMGALYLKNITSPQDKVYILGGAGLKEELDLLNVTNFGVGADPLPADFPTDIDGPESVDLDPNVTAVVVGYDKHISLMKLIKATSYASKVSPDHFVSLAIDRTWTPTGPTVVPGSGAFTNFVSYATNREPVYVGKPSANFYRSMLAALPTIDPQRSLMVGDQLDTDMMFARLNGIRLTLLVGLGQHLTFEDASAIKDAMSKPDYYTTDLGSLRALL
ncbi:Glycerol-3-phosphate phosphatase [Halotydeus destructor]|nr:Glycerol-3-phosphate phosphatase [Halotydeus destructor]